MIIYIKKTLDMPQFPTLKDQMGPTSTNLDSRMWVVDWNPP